MTRIEELEALIEGLEEELDFAEQDVDEAQTVFDRAEDALSEALNERAELEFYMQVVRTELEELEAEEATNEE